ncbi:hypothetical protein JQC67_07200 [Aurantibacter crassamenti]|uniref:hypothetical protein n=1 Tax=Aurantibacter crassamenti TaxID=1837375 RepID=UPI001939F936|nr:hypothetical protein [Aurantibacter crassamenti]MBM1105917.1 hypothetical protein [Aurantibacter crassamenti]
MSNKIKSSLFLSCFIIALSVYNFSMPESENNYSNSIELANADIQNANHALEFDIVNNK